MAKGFVKLPTETIQHISSFLPLENQVVLALSCKLTLSLLGSLSWTGVKGVIKLRLLGLLARDMPRATVCFQCGVIHIWNDKQIKKVKLRGCDDSKRLSRRHLPPHSTIQLAVKQLRLGEGAGIPTRALSLYQVRREKNGSWTDKTSYVKLSGSNLMSAMQFRTWWLTPEELHGGNLFKLASSLTVCQHTTSYPDYRDGGFDILNCWQAHIQAGHDSCAWCTQKGECEYCPLEYEIAIRRKDKAHVLVVNVWRDLGPGYSEHDEEWKRQADVWVPEWDYEHESPYHTNWQPRCVTGQRRLQPVFPDCEEELERTRKSFRWTHTKAKIKDIVFGRLARKPAPVPDYVPFNQPHWHGASDH